MFDPTLNGVMAQIEAGKIVLPAMQRPFVWKHDRITKLIDSMLRGFPLGTALLWKTATMQRFRRFEKDVQPDAGITFDFDSDHSTERYLVLDGQQRLTSLFVAIAGTYDGKKVFLDVLTGVRGDKDPGDAYWDCRFLTEKEAKELNTWPRAGEDGNRTERAVFVKFQDLTRLPAARAGVIATQRGIELGLEPAQLTRMTASYLQCATALASKTQRQDKQRRTRSFGRWRGLPRRRQFHAGDDRGVHSARQGRPRTLSVTRRPSEFVRLQADEQARIPPYPHAFRRRRLCHRVPTTRRRAFRQEWTAALLDEGALERRRLLRRAET